MDSVNIANYIELADGQEASKNLMMSFDVIKETIIHELLEICDSLEEAYLHITKYLFSGENAAKASHKQMYWRIFGQIAVAYLEANLQDCSRCPTCGERIPSWDTAHLCPVATKGLIMCIDCGVVTNRTNSRQCRCDKCQSEYRKATERLRLQRLRYKQGR